MSLARVEPTSLIENVDQYPPLSLMGSPISLTYCLIYHSSFPVMADCRCMIDSMQLVGFMQPEKICDNIQFEHKCLFHLYVPRCA